MLNRICLQGRLTHEPEGKLTSNQTQYCNFRIACQRDFKRADGGYDTDFIDCVAWRQSAVFIVTHFHKGDLIIIDGKLQVDNYTDSEGKNRSKYQVAVDSVNFGGVNTTQRQNTEPAPEEITEDPEDTSEFTASSELPFEVG